MDKEDKPAQRIRFGDVDEESGVGAQERALQRRRRSSVGSLSIHSAGGGTRNVEPGAALPIAYRTLSIEVNEENQQKQTEIKRAKEKGAVDLAGLEWCVQQPYTLLW